MVPAQDRHAHVPWQVARPAGPIRRRTTTAESSSVAAGDASARATTAPRRACCCCCARRALHAGCGAGVQGTEARWAAEARVTTCWAVCAGRRAPAAAACEQPRPRRRLSAWRLDATVCGSCAVKLISFGQRDETRDSVTMSRLTSAPLCSAFSARRACVRSTTSLRTHVCGPLSGKCNPEAARHVCGEPQVLRRCPIRLSTALQ